MNERILGLVCAALVPMGFVGCGKPQVEDASVIKAAESQPGAAEVMAALDKKDFDGVLAALNKVREKVSSDEQNVQFMLLARQVREKITEIAPNDPKAMEVVVALRSLVVGR